MLLFVVCALIFKCSFSLELQKVFAGKHCIDASLISIPTNTDSLVVLDSATVAEAPVNETRMDSQEFTKSVLSQLNELAQFNQVDIVFKLLHKEGPSHALKFTVSLVLGGEYYQGTGLTLKKAQEDAAASALQNTFYLHPPQKIKKENVAITPTVALNNIATKLGLAVSYSLLNGNEYQAIDSYGATNEAFGKSISFHPKWNSTFDALRVPVEEPQVSGPFNVRAKVGELVFEGIGLTIQAARHDAASKAIKELGKQSFLKQNVCSREDSWEQCKELKDSIKSPISRVNEESQIRNLQLDFTVLSESGKSHQKIFTIQCKLGDFVTEGTGTSKKEAKRMAAEQMLYILPQSSPSYNENAIVKGLQNKKKKRRRRKVITEDVDSVVSSLSNTLASMWGSYGTKVDYSSDTNDQTSRTSEKSTKSTFTSPKEKLLEIGNKLDIQVDFIDLKQQNGNFYCLLNLGVQPPQVCLGKGGFREMSHDEAALSGLTFLRKSGVLDGTEFAKESIQFDEEFEVDEGNTHRKFDDWESY